MTSLKSMALLLALTSSASAATAKSFDSWLNQQLQRYHINGAQIAIIHGYQLKWAKSYGLANQSHHYAVTNNTLFRIGSVTKPLAALLTLQAVNDHKLTLTSNINRYLQGWQVPTNHFTKNHPVTIAELLDHTAGINAGVDIGYRQGHPVPSLMQILHGKKPAHPIMQPRWIDYPGKAFHYSNSGYMLLQPILQQQYHDSYSQLFYNRIRLPLHIQHTSYLFGLTQRLNQHSPFAMGYDDYKQPIESGPSITVRQTASGLWSTATDLSQFVLAIQRGLAHHPSVIDYRTAIAMTKPQVKISDNVYASYGFDTILLNKHYTRRKERDYFMKTGSELGFAAVIIGSLRGGDGIVVLLNGCNDRNTKPLPKPPQHGHTCMQIKRNATSLRSLIIRKIAAIEHW